MHLRKHRPRLAKAPDDELMLLDVVTHLGSIPRKVCATQAREKHAVWFEHQQCRSRIVP